MGERHAPLFHVNTLVLHLYMLSIHVGYYKLPALVFHASLVRVVSSFMINYTLLFHCGTCYRVVYVQISLLVFVLEQEKVACGSDMSKNLHSLVDH